MPRLVALEEHYYSKAVFEAIDEDFQQTLKHIPGLVNSLRGIDGERLQAMDEGDISLQVVSHAFTPGGPAAQRCREGNDELAADIAKSPNPSRFAAFAVLPVTDPAGCAEELDRCVSELGFVGALIDNHANGKHFDSPAYHPFWAKVVALDVPIYLHPTFPTKQASEAFEGYYSNTVASSLGAAGWGWHSDVALHILKLFAAGIFDKFPSLKIIIGHMGEMLPFMLERCMEMSTSFAGGWGNRERDLKQVWNENIWITTSGVWSLAPMKCILENTKVEHIMYSVDWPFSSNAKGRRWFEQLETSGLLNREQLDMIGYGNAERLMNLRKS